MFILIKNCNLYTPKHLGLNDILICNDKIIDINKSIKFEHETLKVIDAKGRKVVPGFIDQHVHITGGGGEGSFKTRVPEIMLSQLTKNGITTVVGLLGTDSITRNIENLLAKTKALNEEGITAYCLTGSYDYPSPTLTGSVKKDITFLNEVIGVKLAISDHRSPLITKDELKKLASDVRTAGLFSGKKAYIKLHMGSADTGLSVINDILNETDLSIKLFRPTHVSRSPKLFIEALDFAKRGGIIDITCESTNKENKLNELFELIESKEVPLENITFSTDAMGSWSKYDDFGNLIEIGYSTTDSMLFTFKSLVLDNILTIEQALKLFTSNVSYALGLNNRGVIKVNNYADIVIINEQLEVETVLSNGAVMIHDKEIIVKGTYEV